MRTRSDSSHATGVQKPHASTIRRLAASGRSGPAHRKDSERGAAFRFGQLGLAGRTLLIATVGLLGIACEQGSNGTSGGSTAAVETAPSSGTASAATTGMRAETVAGLKFSVPEAWKSEAPQSSMRVAQYRMSGPGGDAELILFRFPGGGGSAAANVERWIAQLEQPDGTPSSERAKVQTAESDGLKLTRLDVSGKFGGQQMPGAPPQPPIENARMLALVVEGPGDPYFFKLLGPAETVSQWADAWEALIQSIALE